jgi:hypothetical protein
MQDDQHLIKAKQGTKAMQEWYAEGNMLQVHTDAIIITPQEQINWERQKELQQNSSISENEVTNEKKIQETTNNTSARVEPQGSRAKIRHDPQRHDIIVIIPQQHTHPGDQSDAQRTAELTV